MTASRWVRLGLAMVVAAALVGAVVTFVDRDDSRPRVADRRSQAVRDAPPALRWIEGSSVVAARRDARPRIEAEMPGVVSVSVAVEAAKHVVTLDGLGVHALTPIGDVITVIEDLPTSGQLVVTPDGRRVAYLYKESDGGTRAGIYEPARGATELPAAGGELLGWSPDGRSLWFQHRGEELRRLDLTTHEIQSIVLDGHAGLFSLSPDGRHLLTQEYRHDAPTTLMLYRVHRESAELIVSRDVSDRMRPAHPLWVDKPRVVLQLLPDEGILTLNTDRWTEAAGIWLLELATGELTQVLPTRATPGLVASSRWLLLREYDANVAATSASVPPSNRGVWLDLTTGLTVRLTIPPDASIIGWSEPLFTMSVVS